MLAGINTDNITTLVIIVTIGHTMFTIWSRVTLVITGIGARHTLPAAIYATLLAKVIAVVVYRALHIATPLAPYYYGG